jgi:hypothetical protein
METWGKRSAIPELADKTRLDYAHVWEKHIRRKLGGYALRGVNASGAGRVPRGPGGGGRR